MKRHGLSWEPVTDLRTVWPPEATRRCAIRGTALARCHLAVGTFQQAGWSLSDLAEAVQGREPQSFNPDEGILHSLARSGWPRG